MSYVIYDPATNLILGYSLNNGLKYTWTLNLEMESDLKPMVFVGDDINGDMSILNATDEIREKIDKSYWVKITKDVQNHMFVLDYRDSMKIDKG